MFLNGIIDFLHVKLEENILKNNIIETHNLKSITSVKEIIKEIEKKIKIVYYSYSSTKQNEEIKYIKSK